MVGLKNRLYCRGRHFILPPFFRLLPKSIVLFIVLLFFCSCSIKHIWLEKGKHSPSNDVSFNIDHGHFIVDATLDYKPGVFLLDFGADANIIWDTTVIHPNTVIGRRNVKGHTSKTTLSLTSYKSLEFLDLSVESPLFYVYNAPQFQTMKGLGISGVISNKYYNELAKCVHLNNTKSTLSMSDCSNVPDGYVMVKSKFDIFGRVEVFLTLDKEIELPFKFDTGAQLSLAVPKMPNHQAIPQATYYGNIGADVTGLVYDTLRMYLMNIGFAGTRIREDSQTIREIPVFKRNIMGLDFIRQFDWIIDYGNREVYVRNNENRREAPSYPEIKVKLRGNALVASMKKLSSISNIEVDDVILENASSDLKTEQLLDLADSLNSGKLLINDIGFDKL